MSYAGLTNEDRAMFRNMNNTEGPRKPDNIPWSVWETLSEDDKNDAWAEAGLNQFLEGQEENPIDENNQRVEVNISAGPMDGQTPGEGTQRWPMDQIQAETDYVFFQFGKYIPPFGTQAGEAQRDNPTSKRAGYEASSALLKPDPSLPGIMLPIPQDLSNTIAAGWQGKQFTGIGRSAIAASAGNMHFARQKIDDWSGNISALTNSLTTNVLNLVPGVGGNLDANDISGSTRGVVLNPNAELLYDSPELREIGMTFKMVPKNSFEASTIRNICNTFRKAALPVWGGNENDGQDGNYNWSSKVTYEMSGNSQGATGLNADETTADRGDVISISKENFIQVPSLCKFTFMKGNSPHAWLTQYKACAISNVVVNYTPDNTYATYSDGSPVATEIRLNFQETKLIFRGDVDTGF